MNKNNEGYRDLTVEEAIRRVDKDNYSKSHKHGKSGSLVYRLGELIELKKLRK